MTTKAKIIQTSFMQELRKFAQYSNYKNQKFPNQKELDVENVANSILNEGNPPKSKADSVLDNMYSDDFSYDRGSANDGNIKKVKDTADANNTGAASDPELQEKVKSMTDDIFAGVKSNDAQPNEIPEVSDPFKDSEYTAQEYADKNDVWGTRDGFRYKTQSGYSDDTFNTMDEATAALHGDDFYNSVQEFNKSKKKNEINKTSSFIWPYKI